jgi:hypothetical protein
LPIVSKKPFRVLPPDPRFRRDHWTDRLWKPLTLGPMPSLSSVRQHQKARLGGRGFKVSNLRRRCPHSSVARRVRGALILRRTLSVLQRSRCQLFANAAIPCGSNEYANGSQVDQSFSRKAQQEPEGELEETETAAAEASSVGEISRPSVGARANPALVSAMPPSFIEGLCRRFFAHPSLMV